MSIAMRPGLELTVGLGAEQVIERLKQAASEPKCICRVEVFYGDQVEVRIARDHHHTWSPQVVLFLQEHEEGEQTTLRGKFGPDGQIWTMFMAGYACAGMLAMGGGVVLSSQMMLEGQSRWGLWLVLVGGALALFVYLASQVGQRLAEPQMKHIDALIQGALETSS